MKPSIVAIAALILGSFLPAIAQTKTAPPITRLYVFGDSYSDIGEGYLDGNGPTAVAYFADHLDSNCIRQTLKKWQERA